MNLLTRQLEGAKLRREPFPATRLGGPSGVGKTQLAECLAEEYGSNLVMADGYHTPVEITEKLLVVKEFDFFFVDECHTLTSKAQELFFQVLDHSRVPVWAEKSSDSATDAEPMYRSINPCTIVFATDQPGRMLNALDKRISLRIELSYYPPREMKEIVELVATELNLLLTPHAANAIARRSGGLPRIAKQHLENLRRHYPDSEQRTVELLHVRKFFRAFGVDELGLGPSERKYLSYLLSVEKAGLESLASYLGVDCNFVQRRIEPQLLREQLVVIRPGGRELTAKGKQWVNKPKETQKKEGVSNG